MDTHPGFATDLLFERYQGCVTQHPAFWAIQTPDAPHYFFGNYLLLPSAPSDQDKEWLETSFDQLIGQDPRIRHRTFQWPLADGEHGRLAAFVSSGYQYLESVVLALDVDNWQPALSPLMVEARPFEATDWDAWIALELDEQTPGDSDEHYQRDLDSRRALYQAMIADGLGQWWGVWQDNLLVASCGLFFTDTMGRFQLVRTRRTWRNQGLCRQLLSQVARKGFERVPQLIIVADEHYHAQQVYRALGFTPVARMGSLCRWPHAANELHRPCS